MYNTQHNPSMPFTRKHQHGTLCGIFLYYLVSYYLLRGTVKASSSQSEHIENFAVIVSTSKYYFNYRHSANALGIYNYIKKIGDIPDSNIILMLADDLPCDARNPLPGQVYISAGTTHTAPEVIHDFAQTRSLDDLYRDADIDYKGSDVTAENFLRILTGQHQEGESMKRKLPSHSMANVLVYMTGHGGDGFIKFNDEEEVLKDELAHALRDMFHLGRYNEVLFMVDSCQSFTLCDNFEKVPNSMCTASSLLGENSYAHHYLHPMLGLSVVDKYTRNLLIFLNKQMKIPIGKNSTRDATFQDFMDSIDPHSLRAHPGLTGSSLNRSIHEVAIKDFFHMSAVVEKPVETKSLETISGLSDLIASLTKAT